MRLARTCVGVALVLFGLWGVQRAQAQSPDDWKQALEAKRSGKGCESIPYANYREECTKKQEKIEEKCGTNGEKWTCKGLETRSFKVQIDNMSRKLEELKEQKERMNDEKSNTDNIQKEMDDISKELEFQKKSLETDLRDIDIRLDKGRECLDARLDVQTAYKNAIDSGDRVTDPDIKEIARELVAYWEKGRDGHEDQIRAVKDGIENCNKCKSGDR